MSDTTATPEPVDQNDDRPSMGREIARETTINLAANAAAAVGFVGGLVLINKAVAWHGKRRKAKESQENPQVTETQES